MPLQGFVKPPAKPVVMIFPAYPSKDDVARPVAYRQGFFLKEGKLPIA